MDTAQQLSRKRSGGRPKKGDRRSLYVRVAPRAAKAFADEAAAAGVYQPDLMTDICSKRYGSNGEHGPMPLLMPPRQRQYQDRVALEVKIPSGFWTLLSAEAGARKVSLSDHVEDMLSERYQLTDGEQQDEGSVVRRSA